MKLLVWFKDVDREDVGLVGGKGANLGEMVKTGFPVPNGFIVTAPAYFEFLRENKLETKIKEILKEVNYQDPSSLEKISKLIKKEILKGKISPELIKLVFRFYRVLGGVFKDALVAVRSSATAEDLPQASFAGQQETFLNVQGEANLIQAIRGAWASLFTPRAIFYRHENKFDHLKVGIAIAIQRMVESEKSGVMFTIDPVTNDKNKIVIEAIWGLGELIVQGTVSPDHYEVDKKNLEIKTTTVTPQTIMLVKKGKVNKEIKVGRARISKQKLTEKEIKTLAVLAKKIESHYYFPQDIEWAIEKAKIYLVQTRPVTTTQNSKFKIQNSNSEFLTLNSKLILRGDPASPGLATGPVRIIHEVRDINKILPGDILVAPKTNPDYVVAMKKVAGIVTDSGGRTSHAAIVSRELGIPAVVGAGKATKILKEDMVITINGSTGEIFKGGIERSNYKLQPTISNLQPTKTATRLYVNLSEPNRAPEIAKMDVDGVGLLRAEFILAKIGTHPKKLLEERRQKKFINYLVDGLRVFCESFNPRPVVYRASDFKTNEYRNLTGGKIFEPEEENPMLGYRGAFRYIADPRVFKLELEAIKIVREDLNLSNLWLMIPFVRSVKELLTVKKMVAETGLLRYPSFKLWMMVEVPINVILIEEFLKTGIDGISIGSNDLTMLLLGTDRDNSELKTAFEEQNPAALWAFERVIKAAHRHHVTSSICGEAPSDHPELIDKLVEWGITSISVESDSLSQTRSNIATAESRCLKSRKFTPRKY